LQKYQSSVYQPADNAIKPVSQEYANITDALSKAKAALDQSYDYLTKTQQRVYGGSLGASLKGYTPSAALDSDSRANAKQQAGQLSDTLTTAQSRYDTLNQQYTAAATAYVKACALAGVDPNDGKTAKNAASMPNAMLSVGTAIEGANYQWAGGSNATLKLTNSSYLTDFINPQKTLPDATDISVLKADEGTAGSYLQAKKSMTDNFSGMKGDNGALGPFTKDLKDAKTAAGDTSKPSQNGQAPCAVLSCGSGLQLKMHDSN
jgi:hypothetical protein